MRRDVPVRLRDEAFLVGEVRRFRVAAAFLPAAIRFGDFLEVARFRAGALRAVVRFRAVAALRAGRFLVAAAFLPAAIRFGDFLEVVRFRVVAALRAVVRFRVAAAFLPAAIRFGDFLEVDFPAVGRLLVAAFFPAATRDRLAAERFLAGAFDAREVVVRRSAGRVRSSPGGAVGAC